MPGRIDTRAEANLCVSPNEYKEQLSSFLCALEPKIRRSSVHRTCPAIPPDRKVTMQQQKIQIDSNPLGYNNNEMKQQQSMK